MANYNYQNQACIQQNDVLGIQEEDSGTIDDGVGSDQGEGGQETVGVKQAKSSMVAA